MTLADFIRQTSVITSMATRKKVKKLNISEAKLGQNQAFGMCWKEKRKILIDPRLPADLYLETLIHELIHAEFPELVEERVEKAAAYIAQGVWQQNFRKVSK